MVFKFTANSDSQNALKYLIIGGDIPLGTNEEKLIPEAFYLSQNFPNPFNPTTNINYTVPNDLNLKGDAAVILKVFDILGNEISTLVDENQSPGSYNVKFNGSEFPSGVYFYQLRISDLVSTKKLILMK